MKTFEIEVVRSFRTTFVVELPDNLTESDVERITMYNNVIEEEEDIYDEIWDTLSEAELQHMDVQTQTVKAKEL